MVLHKGNVLGFGPLWTVLDSLCYNERVILLCYFDSLIANDMVNGELAEIIRLE